MQLETIDRYLTEIDRQLRIVRPTHSDTNREIAADGINRINLKRLRLRLRKQRWYRLGHEDRVAGYGAATSIGAYLDGYYSDGGMYYVTQSDLDGVRFGRMNLYSR